jgi:hypothetical protein
MIVVEQTGGDLLPGTIQSRNQGPEREERGECQTAAPDDGDDRKPERRVIFVLDLVVQHTARDTRGSEDEACLRFGVADPVVDDGQAVTVALFSGQAAAEVLVPQHNSPSSWTVFIILNKVAARLGD